MGDFRMPALGAAMTEGRVVEWLVHPGDRVRRGDVVAVIDTDKAALEVEVWEDGVVEALVVGEGDVAPVGAVLARLGAGEADAATAEAARSDDEPLRVPEPIGATASAGLGTARAAAVARVARDIVDDVRVQSPLTRRLAHDLHVDLRDVDGTGPGGRVTRQDVEAAVAAPTRTRATPYARRLAAERGVDVAGLVGSGPRGAVVAVDVPAAPASPPTTPAPAGPDSRREAMRRAVARTVEQSNRDVPHYYLGTSVDVTSTLAWLAERNEGRAASEQVLLAAVVCRAVALGLAAHPELNGHWVDGGFVPSPTVDLGVAVALRGGGLVTPTLPRADTLDLDATMQGLRRLVRSARSARLRGADVAPASATLTSLGDLGVETVYGVVLPPQVALVGAGRPVARPWVVDGELRVRDVVHLTLAADHRQSDGLLGSRFLATVALHLERPERP